MGREQTFPRRWCGGWLVALLPLALAGCGGRGEISGQVKFKGQPLAWGRINFVCLTGKQTTHFSMIRLGSYTIKGCPAGPVKISVEAIEARPISDKAPKMMVERSRSITGGADEPPREAIGKFVPIPLKYANPESSGLEYIVQRGPQTHDIDLKP
jgi:hypothetical protein